MNSKRTYVVTIATLGLLGLGSSRPAAAQFTYIPDNTTIDAGHSIADSAIVGYADATDYFGGVNGSSPTVDLVAGGSVGGSLFADNGSTINVSGGSITGALDATGTSTINITGGNVGFGTQGYLAADGGSNVTISGGQFGEVGNVDFIDGTSGSFNFVGTGIGATLIGGSPETGFTYQLSGTLQDGHSITGDQINVDTDNYSPSATPEPSSNTLFAVAGLAMLSLILKARKRTASLDE